jgi:DNA polymerase-1
MGNYKVIKEQQVFEKFGCKPQHVVDALAIIGDAADAVPGVAGIGEKGAAGLIQQFGSLEEIYERLPEIKPALVQKLIKSKSTAFLSKELVKIKQDIPISYSEDEVTLPPDVFKRPELQSFFVEMEFRSFTMQSSDLIADFSGL